MSRSYYTRLLDTVFADVKRIVQKRQNSIGDMTWILSSHRTVHPDYFLVKSFGRTRFEAWMNSVLFRLAPYLWRRIVWKKMCNKMCRHLRDEHALHFDLPRDDKKLFVNVCYQHLYNHWNFWGNTTFSDIFMFIALYLQKFSEDVLKTPDRFREIKISQNTKMLELIREIKDDLVSHSNATSIMAYLAIKGNWMDVFENDPEAFFFAFSEEVNEVMDSDAILKTHRKENTFFHIESLLSAVEGTPKTIVYECDNSGEVVLDLVFIEHLIKKGHTLYVTTKSAPFLNDVCDNEIQNLIADHFPNLTQSIEANKLTLLTHELGFAGKFFSEVKNDYKKALQQADFMILKGQGHFQTMPMVDLIHSGTPIPYRLPVFYLLGVRADIIHWCCTALFKKTIPEKGTVMLYAYNFENSASHPS